MKRLLTLLLGALLVGVAFVIGYLVSTFVFWLLLLTINKAGIALELNIWWGGLSLHLAWLFFFRK